MELEPSVIPTYVHLCAPLCTYVDAQHTAQHTARTPLALVGVAGGTLLARRTCTRPLGPGAPLVT